MGLVNSKHRPMLSGVGINSRGPLPGLAPGDRRDLGSGTFTGVATRRSDGKQMLVTNLHVLAGADRVPNSNIEFYRNVSGHEEMYQGGLSAAYRVGINPTGVDLDLRLNGYNEVDVAMCEATYDSVAAPRLHGAGHTARYIARGTVTPRVGMQLVLLGRETGEANVIVREVGVAHTLNKLSFTGAVVLNTETKKITPGDSGAPCFFKVRDGVYKLACIVYAGFDAKHGDQQQAYAFPASKAQDLLGIRFGKRAPVAKIVQSPLDVRHGDTVVLSGVESTDPDGDPLTYKWFQEPRVGGVGVELSSATAPVTMFTAPSQDTTLVFNLTVTNVVGDTATATVNVVVNAPEPAGPPAPEPPPDTLVDIPPLDIGKLIPEAWSKWLWADVWQGSCENRTRKRFRVSSKGRIEVRWVPDPEPTVWEETGPPTGETRGCGATKEVEQTVGNNCNDETRTVWVAAPEELEWTKTPTGNTRGCGETKETEYIRTSQCGDTETVWESTPEDTPPPSAWERTGNTRGCGPSHESEESRTLGCGGTETQWVSTPQAVPPGDWVDTAETRGCGPTQEKEQSRTDGCDNVFYQWVADPQPDPPGPWGRTGRTRGCGQNRESEESRTTPCGVVSKRWVSTPTEVPWGEWENVSPAQVRGCGATREVQQVRENECNDFEYRWVSSAEDDPWGDWTRTGNERGCGPAHEVEEERISEKCKNKQTRWLDDPVDEVFPAYTRTGATRGCGPTLEAEESTTGDCGTVRTRWVAAPLPDPWGNWAETGQERGCGPTHEKQMKRTSICGRTEYDWVADPESEEWGDWTDTGNQRWNGLELEKEQSRTSNCNNTQTRWLPEPEEWGDWSRTGSTRGCGPTKEAEESRTSNYNNTETRWVDTPEEETWGEWTRTGNTNELNPVDIEYEEERTSNCGNKETRWVTE